MHFISRRKPESHGALWKTGHAIYSRLGNLVHTRATEVEWMARVEDFKMLWQLANCVAAIDGKHVVKPAKSGSLYYNYKKTFVFFVLTDARYNSKYIHMSSSASNGGVWSRTPWASRSLVAVQTCPKQSACPTCSFHPLS